MNPRVAALIDAAKADQELKAALQGATTPEESVRVAREFGMALDLQDLADVRMLDASDAELESVGGGQADNYCCTYEPSTQYATCSRDHFPWLR